MISRIPDSMRSLPRASTIVASAVSIAALIAIYCRYFIWSIVGPIDLMSPGSLAAFFGASYQDSITLFVLALLAIIGDRLVGLTRYSIFFIVVLASISISFASLINLIGVQAVGSVIDSAWIGDAKPRDFETSLPIIRSSLTDSMIRLIFRIWIMIPCVVLLAGLLLNLRIWFVASAALIWTVGSLVSTHLFHDRYEGDYAFTHYANPVYLLAQDVVAPSKGKRYVYGSAAELSDFSDSFDWEIKPAQPATHACCVGDHLLLVTLDTVPLKSIDRALSGDGADRFPNIAKIRNGGAEFRNFYAHFPMSAQSMGSFMTSIYPSQQPGVSTLDETADRRLPTLSQELEKEGFRAAHYMSGQLKFGGAAEFLVDRGFERVEDSDSLSCGKEDVDVLRLYSHITDACVAEHSINWIGSLQPDDRMFLWAWFSNPHSPYYNGDPMPAQGTAGDFGRHLEALAMTDHAIGELLAALDKTGRLEKTLIVLVADHGEAFGEHGHTNHGHSIFEEQVNVPLIFYRPGAIEPSKETTIGGIVDLAPSILDLLGIQAPRGWQGMSVYADDRPQRTYFSSQRGARQVGYRDGEKKYILRARDNAPVMYDLAKDPNEITPIALSETEADAVMRRIGAYVRFRKSLEWPTRTQ